jgi:hypothetical protein
MAGVDLTRESSLTQRYPRNFAFGLVAALATVAVAVLVWLWPTQPLPGGLQNSGSATGAEPVLTTGSTSAIELATHSQILANRSPDWHAARLAENPRILVVEFPDLAVQGSALNRLAALIEKYKAPRDHLLSDEGLAKFIKHAGDTSETFYFGHDYQAEAVARFFNLAVLQQARLNADELRLRKVLLEANFLREEGGRMVAYPGPQAVVTFTAVQADRPQTQADETIDAQRREAILRHELSHGEFFTNVDYRDHCWIFWQQLADSDRSVLRRFLTDQGYDPQNEALMVNEVQAFLMHTPDDRVVNARLIGLSQSRLDGLRTRFRHGLPPTIFSTIDRQ